jgi:hypothetical protein
LNGPGAMSKSENFNEEDNAKSSYSKLSSEERPQNVELPINPPDFILQLGFRVPGSHGIPTCPQVPRIFSGESRLGEVWNGSNLVEKYAEAGPGRFIAACNGDERIANKMYSALNNILNKEHEK